MCMRNMQQYPDYIASEELWITKAKDRDLSSMHVWHTKAEEVGGGDYREEGSK